MNRYSLFIAALTLSLAACGDRESVESPGAATSAPEPVAETQAPPAADPKDLFGDYFKEQAIGYGWELSLEGFGFALSFGILTGTYSTIFIASPVLLWVERRWPSEDVKVVKGAGMVSLDWLLGKKLPTKPSRSTAKTPMPSTPTFH